MAHSRSFLANQKARNAIVGAGNLLKLYIVISGFTCNNNNNNNNNNNGDTQYLIMKSQKWIISQNDEIVKNLYTYKR